MPQWALAQVELSTRIGRVPYQEIAASPRFAELGQADNLFDVLLVRASDFRILQLFNHTSLRTGTIPHTVPNGRQLLA